MRVIRFSSASAWIEAASCDFIAAVETAKAEGRRDCHFCLAGGSTPAPLYRALASDPRFTLASRDLEVHLWLGDERRVGTEAPERNGRMVLEAFSGSAWPFRFHPWPAASLEERRPAVEAAGSVDAGFEAAEAEASAYARELAACLGPGLAFDLALLGIGADGHTASLFAGDPLYGREARDRLARPALAPSAPRERLTLTEKVLRASRCLRILARGRDKAGVIARLERARADAPAGFPAQSLDGQSSAVLYFPD